MLAAAYHTAAEMAAGSTGVVEQDVATLLATGAEFTEALDQYLRVMEPSGFPWWLLLLAVVAEPERRRA